MKNTKHINIVLLAKTKLNIIDVLISRTCINLYITHDEFISVNNLVKEYDNIIEEIQNLKASAFIKDFSLFMKVLSYSLKCRKKPRS